jgi:hypothetical protein
MSRQWKKPESEFCAEHLVHWTDQVLIPDFEHIKVALYVNGKKELVIDVIGVLLERKPIADDWIDRPGRIAQGRAGLRLRTPSQGRHHSRDLPKGVRAFEQEGVRRFHKAALQTAQNVSCNLAVKGP